jgi:protein phosphatase
MLTTTYAGLSDLGRQRSRNDDRWGADPTQGLYIVADGVGSTSHGDMAAELVVELLPTYVARHFAGVDLRDGRAGDVTARLGRAVVEMCSDLHARSLTDSQLAGAGTTLVTVVINDSHAVVAHLGDSRAYLYRDRQVQRLTSDHTIVQAVMDAGELSEEEAARHPNRSIVTKHVLMTPPAKPDVNVLDLQPGDRILLCSDGLHGVVDDATLAAILTDQPDGADACRALIACANDAGGPDNITVVVVDAGQASTIAAPEPTPSVPDHAAPPMPTPTTQPTVAGKVPPLPPPASQPPMAGQVPPVPPPPRRRRRPVPPAPPAGRMPPPIGAPPPHPQPPRRRRGRALGLIAVVVVLVAAVGIAGYLVLGPRQTAPQTRTGQSAKPSAQPTPTAQSVEPNPPLKPQIALPFGGLNHPKGVAVDIGGDVYVLVVDGDNTQVLKLTAGSQTPNPLPFSGLNRTAIGIAVDGSGRNVYVIDRTHDGRLMKFVEGSDGFTEVEIWKSHANPLKHPSGVAVNANGDVYVADTENNRVMKISADSGTPTVLRFTGLKEPICLAVDTKGNVYVIDQTKTDQGKNRLLKLAADSNKQELVASFAGVDDPTGVAVDAGGNVYITDGHDHQVLKFSAGSSNPTGVPFTGLSSPSGVAVDTGGNIYVTDDDTGKVVKLGLS